jgi:hypothetical protein
VTGYDEADTIEKGTTVSYVRRSTESPSPSRSIGCLATLRGRLRVGGSGAPASRRRLGVVALGVVVCLVLLVPGGASARFVRPFLRQVTGTHLIGTGEVTAGSDVVESLVTSGGAFAVGEEVAGEGIPAGTTILLVGSGKLAGTLILSAEATKTTVADVLTVKVPFKGPGEIAVDGEDDLRVLEGQGAEGVLDGFGPSGESTGALGLGGHGGGYVAVGSTGILYVAGQHEVSILGKNGEFEASVPMVGENGEAGGIAVDDSSELLGDLYVAGGRQFTYFAGVQLTLRKFDAAGEERDWEHFKGSEACGCRVAGNEIVFNASDLLGEGEPALVTVNPVNGDIWVFVVEGRRLIEFNPGGEVIREIGEEEAPEFEGKAGLAGVEGLAVDPTNGDLLVSLTRTVPEAAGERAVGAVDEFDSAGAFVGRVTEAGGVPLGGAYGLAVDSHGDLYVVNHPSDNESGKLGGAAHAVDEFEAGHFVPGLRPGAATQRRQSSAVLNGFVDPESELNPEKEGIADCRFEYVTEAAFLKSGFEDLSSGGEVPCEDPGAGEIPKSDAETAVHAVVGEHVESGVTYRYRLSATIGGVLGGVGYSAVAAFTAAHAPRVSGTTVSGVTSAFARFSGDVAPLGADTTYQFQYVSEAQFVADGDSFVGAAVAPAAPGDVGVGGEAGDLVEAVSESVGGLAPATTYRFRLVASNEVGVSEGEAGEGGAEVAHTFTTEPVVSSGLPDGRAYELVTPPDKEGAEDIFEEGRATSGTVDLGAASGSGDQFMLETKAAFGSFPASGGNLYVFSRHAAVGHPEREEWSYRSLASPALGLQNLGTSLGAIEPEDFSKAAITDTVGAPGSEVGFAYTSLVGSIGGPYTTLHADQPTHIPNAGKARGFPQEVTRVVGGSRDLGVVVLKSTNPALAGGGVCASDVCAEPPIPSLYEWAGGELKPLDVLSGGEPIGSCGAALGGGVRGEDEEAEDGAVSADGSKVFLTAPDPESGFGFEGVKGCPAITANGYGDVRSGRFENPPELYLRSGEETVEVSAPAVEEGAPESKANFEAVFLGAADDGSRVLFASEGELTANDRGIHDMELYEYDTETGKLTRISAGDSGDAAGDVVPFGQRELGIGVAGIKDVVVSGDGSRVYFVARGVLAPGDVDGEPVEGQENLYVYDTQTGRTAFIASGTGGTFEYAPPETTPAGRYLLYPAAMISNSGQLDRYDAETEGVVCVSCTPSYPAGVPVLAPSNMGDGASPLGALPAHAISEDGSVFLNTTASLVAQDTNGVADVYEWHEGTISLISSGGDSLNSYFLGASPDGANVFFGSHARLVAADTSGGGNVYDARVCTASEPCIAPPPGREGLCEGDACSHPAAAPSDATPASATFSGPGNLTPTPAVAPRVKTCAKPRRLSHGRCVVVKPKRRKAKAKAEAGRARGKTTAKRAKRDRGGRSS